MSTRILEVNLGKLTMKGWHDEEKTFRHFEMKFKNTQELVEELERYTKYVKTFAGLLPYEKARFTYDAPDCVYIYEGYHNHQDWNGWAKPHFEFEEAKQLLEDAQNEYATGFRNLQYDKESDTFKFQDGDLDDEWYEYQGFDIEVDGKTVHVYDIGSGAWCWCVTKREKGDF